MANKSNIEKIRSIPDKNKPKSNVGNVYRANTKYIDKDTKRQRNYVVVKQDGDFITVSKLKTIKKFDEKNKNADKALVEINYVRYGLKNRTGVDFQRFNKNRLTKKNLILEDKRVFPESNERFKLGSHDLNRTLQHTGVTKRHKKKR